MVTGVSVIIPTYNREKLVRTAIESILNQEFEGDIEIIISDDGSTDSTLQVVSSFGNKVRIIEKPLDCKVRGASMARNRGIKAATNPYLCFLDSDDFFLPFHLKKMLAFIESCPQADFAFCRILDYKKESNIELYRPWTMLNVFKRDIINPVISRDLIVHTNGFIFKSKIFKEIGYFNENYRNGEDSDMWIRISEKFKGKFSNHYGAVYRMNLEGNEQLHKTPPDNILDIYKKILEDALKRYHILKIKNPYRKYRIKMKLLNSEHNSNWIQRKVRWFILISKNPLFYLYDWKVRLIEKRDKNIMRKWSSLQEFID